MILSIASTLASVSGEIPSFDRTVTQEYKLQYECSRLVRRLPILRLRSHRIVYHSTESGQKRTFGVTGLFLISCGVIGFVLSAQVFIEFIFGNEWVLPVEVGALFAVQEILRGYYQSSAIKLVSLGGSSFISRISLLLILCAVTLMVLLINQFGLIGAPISMILIYILLTYLVFNKIKASTR